MLYRLVRPMRRKGSSSYQFIQRVPADVKKRAVGTRLAIPVGPETIPLTITAKTDAVRVSLRTSQPAEVKLRHATVAAYLECVWRSIRHDAPVSLTHRQATALAGELYAAWADERRTRTYGMEFLADGSAVHLHPSAGEDEPELWESAISGFEERSAEDLEPALGPVVDRLLMRRGIGRVDEASRLLLHGAFKRALIDAFAHRREQADGDYSEDPNASRFPAWHAPGQGEGAVRAPASSLKRLVDDWWSEARAGGRSVSTYESYKGAFVRLSAFVGHDDAGEVTASDLIRFKDHRLASGISPKTVGDGDLAAFRSVFAWAVDNLKLDGNPAEKVRVTRLKRTRRRSKSLTLEEAIATLRHCLHHNRGRERPKTHAAKRWVPWLCAYTGARLGEMVQLRKRDLRQDGQHWVITITPEAGTVKDKEVREVVLHADLVASGFPDFVTGCREGYLFLYAEEGKDIRGVWRSIKNRVTEFVREVITDRDVAPNHGWRHLFKTRGREAGIEDTVLDAICGHAAKSIGAGYGEVTLRAKAEAMAKLPTFGV